MRIVLSNPQKAKSIISHLGKIANTALVGFRYALVRGYHGVMLFLGFFLLYSFINCHEYRRLAKILVFF